MPSLTDLPDELLLEILRWAMMRETPLPINEFARSVRAPMHEGENVLPTFRMVFIVTNLDQMLSCRDWRVAGFVCRDFCRLCRVAFFSGQVFVMDLDDAKSIQTGNLSGVRAEDQRTASMYIRAIIVVEKIHLRSFMRLPSVVAGFPRLDRLDFFVGDRWGQFDSAGVIAAAKARMQTPLHFTDVLRYIGVPTDRLDIGILMKPGAEWNEREKWLHENVYPTLKAWARVRARRQRERETQELERALVSEITT